MIKAHNRKAWLIGGAGFVLQGGSVCTESVSLFLAMLITGTVLLLIGFAFYAKAKGQSPWWALIGLLGLIGYIVLFALEDRAKEPGAKAAGA